MSGIKVGRSRRKTQENKKPDLAKEAKVLFGLGSAVICLMLVLTISGERREDNFSEAAIPAMSNGIVDGSNDELKRPERDTSAEVEEWSVYDYIGHMIADLLFGER